MLKFLSAFCLFFLLVLNTLEAQTKEEKIDKIRERFAWISQQKKEGLLQETIHKPAEDPGELVETKFYSQKGQLYMIEFSSGTDHGGSTCQFYLWDAELFFVYDVQSYWSFGGPEDEDGNPGTVDEGAEYRFYIDKGLGIKCLEKHYKGYSNKEFNAARGDSKNKEVDCSDNVVEISKEFQRLKALYRKK